MKRKRERVPVVRGSVPEVLQSENSECGIACLCAASSWLGKPISLRTFRATVGDTPDGATLSTLIRFADEVGLHARAVRVELEHLSRLEGPAILHWEMNHFVVLERVRGDRIVVMDPAVGRRTLTSREVSASFTGVALLLAPQHAFSTEASEASLKITSLWTRQRGLGRMLAKLLSVSLGLQLLLLVSPYYVQVVVDQVIVSGEREFLPALAVGFGFLVLATAATDWLRGTLVLHLRAVLGVTMGVNLFRHLLGLPLAFFARRSTGDLVSRLASLDEIRDSLSTRLIESIVDGLMSVAVLIVLFLYSPMLASIVVAAVLIYLAANLALFSKYRSCNLESIVAHAKRDASTIESIRSMQVIKLACVEREKLAGWENLQTDFINATTRVGRIEIGFRALSRMLFGVELVVLVYLAAIAVIESSFTVGMLMAFLAYRRQFVERSQALVENLLNLRLLRLHLDRISEIAMEPAEESAPATPLLPEMMGGLEVREITYRYARNLPPVVENLSFEVRQGESVAIVGRSGSGKTTLMRLMMGLIVPDSGEVRLGGKPLNSHHRHVVRRHFSAVMQDDQLITGSIAENIALGAPEFEWERIIASARSAAIHDEIMEMPMNYSSLIGEMGSSLSGGQRQRILLARALYRQPKVLFLDEATSHLDVETEKRVNEAIRDLSITRVMIAHRPETIGQADRVIRLGNPLDMAGREVTESPTSTNVRCV